MHACMCMMEGWMVGCVEGWVSWWVGWTNVLCQSISPSPAPRKRDSRAFLPGVMSCSTGPAPQALADSRAFLPGVLPTGASSNRRRWMYVWVDGWMNGWMDGWMVWWFGGLVGWCGGWIYNPTSWSWRLHPASSKKLQLAFFATGIRAGG